MLSSNRSHQLGSLFRVLANHDPKTVLVNRFGFCCISLAQVSGQVMRRVGGFRSYRCGLLSCLSAARFNCFVHRGLEFCRTKDILYVKSSLGVRTSSTIRCNKGECTTSEITYGRSCTVFAKYLVHAYRTSKRIIDHRRIRVASVKKFYYQSIKDTTQLLTLWLLPVKPTVPFCHLSVPLDRNLCQIAVRHSILRRPC